MANLRANSFAWLCFTATLLASATCGVSAQIAAVAKFDQNGIKGAVTLQPVTGEPGLVKMVVKLDGLDQKADNWHIHELPVQNYDCGSTGGHYNPNDMDEGELTLRHGSFAGMDSIDTIMYDYRFDLDGVFSVMGRSIVIHGGPDRVACATLRPVDAEGKLLQEHIAVATFLGEPGYDQNIKGTVMFRQFEGVKMTQIIVDLNGAGTTGHNWHIHVNPADQSKDDTGVCTSTGGHFDPRNKEVQGYTCDPSKPEECYIGDLAGKHKPLTLPAMSDRDTGPTVVMYTDVDLDLYGANSVIGRGLTIHQGTPRITCATIQDLEPIRSIVTIPGIEGSIKFTQRTHQYDPTVMEIDLQGVSDTYGGWHVHVRPTDPMQPEVCSTGAGTVGGHWIPLPIEITGGFEIGDLAGKWGSVAELADANGNVKKTFIDYFLPLAGPLGISGRSIVLHENSPEKPPLKCGTINFQGASRSVSAIFGDNQVVIAPNSQAAGLPVSGSVLIQGAPSGKGVVFTVKLANTGDALIGNNMHLHVNPVTNNNDCSTAGGHYDPTVKEVTGYACDKADPLNTCYAGDLTGKAGTFDIPVSETPQTVATFYDPNLTLAEVRNLGVVIHSAATGGPRIACGTIASLPVALLEGQVSYTQSRRSPNGPTIMTYSMRNTASDATVNHKWHVHAVPVPADAPNCAGTLGHFDPFLSLGNDYPTDAIRADKRYEMGDMSGKHMLASIAGVNDPLPDRGVESDLAIHLDGEYSINERSITYHVANNGNGRFSCANTLETCPVGYTVCRTSFDCAQTLGGKSAEWECADVSANTLEWCQTMGGDCDILCAGTKKQTVYAGVNTGHCKPSQAASLPYTHGMYIGADTPPPPATTTPPTGDGDGTTTTPPTTQVQPASAGGDDQVVGGVVGGLAVAAVLGAAVVLYRKQSRGEVMKIGNTMISFGSFNAQPKKATRGSSGASSDLEQQNSNPMAPAGNGPPAMFPPPSMPTALEYNPKTGKEHMKGKHRSKHHHHQRKHGGHHRKGKHGHHGHGKDKRLPTGAEDIL